MRRAVFAEPDGIVGEDVKNRKLHQRRQPQGRAHIIAEGQKGGAEGAQLRQDETIDDCAHRVFAYAEMHDAPAGIVRFERLGIIKRRLGRGREVGRAADQPGNVFCDRVENLARRFPRGDAFLIGREDRQAGIPARGQFAGQHQLDLARGLRIFFLIGGECFHPFVTHRAAAPADAVAKALIYAVRHQELRVFRPAVEALGEARFLFAQWIGMRRCSILFMRCAVADDAVDNDQRRSIAGAAEQFQSLPHRRRVIGIAHAHDVPAIALEAILDVFA